MEQPNGWCRRAEAAHRRRPWAGVGAAALVAVVGLVAASGAGADEAPEVATTAAAESTTTTSAAVDTTVTTAAGAPTTPITAVPETTSTTAPVPTETTLPSVALPTTTTTRPSPPTTAPRPGGPPAVSSSCTPGYDPCIVPGDDVDCEGTGDGPRHVRGPVYVEGDDPYGLDDDGDGVACG